MIKVTVNWLKVKQARKRIWMTQIELADKIRMSIKQIQNIEDNWKTTRETLEKIVKVINAPRIRAWFKTELLKKYPVNYFIINE